MLFFDNEKWNCTECSRLGIVCVYTPRGGVGPAGHACPCHASQSITLCMPWSVAVPARTQRALCGRRLLAWAHMSGQCFCRGVADCPPLTRPISMVINCLFISLCMYVHAHAGLTREAWDRGLADFATAQASRQQ